MRARVILILTVASVLLAALPVEAQFKDIRRAVDREIGGDRVWIPFKGLMRLYVKAAKPEGVHDLQFAIYEDADGADRGRIEKIFEQNLGPEWRPFVRVTSQAEGEEVLIYAREGDDGNTIDMMIFAGERDETVLMATTIDVDRFVEGLDEPGGFSSH